MTYSHGADPEELDRVARRLKASALDVQKVRQASDGAVGRLRSAWRGGDLDGAFGAWERTGSTDLKTLETALRQMSQSLTQEATQQRRASGLGGANGTPSQGGGSGGSKPGPGGWPSGGHAGGGGGGGGGGGWGKDPEGSSVSNTHERKWERKPWPRKHDEDEASTKKAGDSDGEGKEEKKKWEHSTNVKLAGFDTKEKHAEVYQHQWGSDKNHVKVSALQATASADGSVNIGKDGVEAKVGGHAAAYAVRVEAAAASDYGQKASGEAYIGAEGNADASASAGLDGVRAKVEADAFAGGKASGDVSQEVMGVTTKVGGEVSYGIGFHAKANADFTMEKVGVNFDVGATLGLGAGFKVDVSVNPSDVIDSVEGLAHGDWGAIFGD